MPFKSKKQLGLFAVKVKKGEMTKQEFTKWLNKTPSVKNLPEKVKKKGQK